MDIAQFGRHQSASKLDSDRYYSFHTVSNATSTELVIVFTKHES